tara:strand:- start:1776 stop:2297 length:522 start_codon:yes stop_codon:yes gene_type:complete
MSLKNYKYKNVNSTNDLAIKKIKKGFLKGIVIADKQKKGRGRYRNKWITMKGNLFMTVFFETKKKITIEKITFKNCLIIKEVLKKYIKEKIKIKPPNDLIIDGKKISGILQEIIEKDSKKFLIIGIGINIINSPKISNYPTTSLSEYTSKIISKTAVCKEIKKLYEKNLKYLQ